MFCNGSGGLGVGFTERGGVLRLELCIDASVIEDEETESGAAKGGALAEPRISDHSGRVIEPVAGVSEGIVKRREEIVSGIKVFVETEVVLLRAHGQDDKQKRSGKGETPEGMVSPRF